MGAMISVFPHQSPVLAATSLLAACGQPIPSWGRRTLPLSFSSSSFGTHRFDWNFMLKAVNGPILGDDFLRHHQFDVSVACHLFISVDGEVHLPLLPSSSPSKLLSKVSVEYQEILASRLRRATWTPRSMPLLIRVRADGEGWHCQAEKFTLGSRPSHGAKTGRFLAPLWRFSTTQQCNSSRQVPRSEHLGFYKQHSRLPRVIHPRPHEGVLPGQDVSR